MNAFKRYVKRKGIKLESDYPYMPYGELDSVWINSEKATVTHAYYTVGCVTTEFQRNGITNKH